MLVDGSSLVPLKAAKSVYNSTWIELINHIRWWRKLTMQCNASLRFIRFKLLVG
jgi:hypothetical protein